jgi:TrmH family RNA methyltransferase
VSLDTPPLAATNPRIKQLRRLIGRRGARREGGRFVVDGPLLIGEAVDAGAAIEAIYVDEALDVDELAWSARVDPACWVPVRAGVLERVLDPSSPRPIAAEVRHRAGTLDELTGPGPVVVLAGLADPGNVGTILRSAAAAGAAGLVVTPDTADPFGPKAVRASAGAALRLPIVELALAEALDGLGAAGRALWFADAAGGRDLTAIEADAPVALVVGNESHGLPETAGGAAATRVRIPMAAGTESLNAAMAATVILFDLARRRA